MLLLSSIISDHVSPDLYRSEPTRRRECLYYLALGHYKMGNFEEAKQFNGVYGCPCSLNYVADLNPAGLLMEKEPTNLQALSLAQLIEKGVTRGTWLCNSSLLSLIHMSL